jgi:hypothetical protein
MKHFAALALILNLGVAGAYAQQRTVKMTFSGNGGPSVVDLKQPNTSNIEENVAGNGTLGTFTFRNISAEALSPQPNNACPGLYFPRVAGGGGVLRFRDGSLMKVTLTQGGDCIDLVHMVGHCTLTLKIIGGNERFQNASGVLMYTETATPVVADAQNKPVFFTEAGEITGTVSGVAAEEERQDERR